MKKRSIYQLRADLQRINLESKSLKHSMKTIAQQYAKQGKAIPKKIQEQRATKRDMYNYLRTLTNNLDKRIEKREAFTDNKFQNLLKELNQVQQARRTTMANELQGYDKSFVNDFLNGKIAVLGRGITTSVVHTKEYSTEKILNLSNKNKVSPIVYLKQQINSYKKDIENFKNDNPKQYALEQIKNIVETAGYNLSDKNMKELSQKVNKLDWLGTVKLIKSTEAMNEKQVYEIYLPEWSQDDNRILMQSLFDSVNRATHNRMVQYIRTID